MKMIKIIGGSIAVAAALALNIQAQNLLVNGDFENAGGFTANPISQSSGGLNSGWASYGAAGQSDMFTSPDSPYSGTAAFLEQNAAGNNWNPAGAYQLVAPIGGITVGATYTLSGYILTDTGVTWTAGGVGIEIGFRGPWNGTTYPTIGTDSSDYWTGVSALNTWTPLSVNEVAPAGATELIVYAQFMDNGQVTTENMYFDAFSVTVPEPSILALLGMGLAVPFYFIRRKS